MKFFSIEELNVEVWKKLDQLNNRPFQNRKGSRWSAFLEEEKFALSPLPATPYRMSEWCTAKVRPDYYISINSMFYSVPYELIGKEMDVKISNSTIEIYFNRIRTTSHQTLYGKYKQISTLKEHMHRLYLEKTPKKY